MSAAVVVMRSPVIAEVRIGTSPAVAVEVQTQNPLLVRVAERGIPGPQGPPGTLTPVMETSGEAIDLGDAVYLDASGSVRRASSTYASGAWRVYGIAASPALAPGDTIGVWVVQGAPVPAARVDSPPFAAFNGRYLFLTPTPGVLSLTPPTSSGNVRFAVAILQGADGATSTPAVRLFPQYVSRTP